MNPSIIKDNTIHRRITAFLIACTFFSLASCKKFVQIAPASNLITSQEVFTDSVDAQSAVLALYIQMMNYSSSLGANNGMITIYTGLASDELHSTRKLSDENSIYANGIVASNNSIATIWRSTYSIIYMANACIQGLQASSGVSATCKDQLIGESEVVRAFLYFNLVNLYGQLPLVTTTDYSLNASKSRSSVDSIYTQIVADLTDAQQRLPVSYPSTGHARPNKYTASALLAKAYLYTGQWANAEATATSVISSGAYSLTPLDNIFLAGSQEAIWQLTPVQAGYETTEGQFFIPRSTTVVPYYILDTFLLHSFESGDLRRTHWVDSNIVSGQTYCYPFKYKKKNDANTTPVEDYMILRLGEQYLIRAEARAELGETTAIDDVNTIRNRSSLSSLSTPGTQAQLLTIIYHERQIELMCEWGNRWYDLKRTGLGASIMPSVCEAKGGSWNNDWLLFPLSPTELQADPFLTQNPGY